MFMYMFMYIYICIHLCICNYIPDDELCLHILYMYTVIAYKVNNVAYDNTNICVYTKTATIFLHSYRRTAHSGNKNKPCTHM